MKTRYQYSNSNKRYYTLDYFYKTTFGKKVFKVSLNGGFTCPNKDGTKGRGGCIYCSKLGSGDFAGNRNEDLVTQFEKTKEILHKKWKDAIYIGYFQANTNTYASVDVLKQKYEPIIALDNVVGLNIATRPDAITEECLDYLEDLSKRTYLTVELGLQTIHEKTSKLINRGHDVKCFDDMVKKLRKRKINVVVHIINGLPYETKEMMIETIKHLNTLDIQGVKIHMLHIIQNTKLNDMYQEHPFHVLTKEEYVDIVCDQLEILRPEIVVHRITGDPNKNDLVEPSWVLKKFCVLNDIDKELERRNTYQGFHNSILNRAHERFCYYIKPNSLVVDATIGNGNDTLYIANIATKGHIFGFDIQKQAIDNTKKLLEEKTFNNVTLYQENHADMKDILKEYIGKISLITFNLGYLPNGNKKVSTNVKDTINAIKASLELVHSKGIILITVYPGHEEGLKESIKLQEFLKDKNVTYYHNTDNKNAPYLIELKKKSKKS